MKDDGRRVAERMQMLDDARKATSGGRSWEMCNRGYAENLWAYRPGTPEAMRGRCKGDRNADPSHDPVWFEHATVGPPSSPGGVLASDDRSPSGARSDVATRVGATRHSQTFPCSAASVQSRDRGPCRARICSK